MIAVGEIVAGVVVIAGAVVLTIVTWGTSTVLSVALIATAVGGLALTGVGIYDTIVTVNGNSADDLTPIHNYLNNLDFSW